jgi:lysophospholipase L1-like esterase
LTIRKDEERYALASGLRDGRHTAVISKRTEGAQTSAIFHGFDYGSGVPAPAPSPRHRIIEIIGDSISAGYGNEGEDAWSGFDLKKENAAAAYGVLAADALDAECYVTAISGQGMYQDLGGQRHTVMPDYYRRALVNRDEPWDFSNYHPDIAVINLGTNDFASGVNVNDFCAAYLDFLKFMRRVHPDCWLVCTCGPILDAPYPHIQRVAHEFRGMGDRRVSTLFFPLMASSEEKGLDGHPSCSMHRKMADILVCHIKEKFID